MSRDEYGLARGLSWPPSQLWRGVEAAGKLIVADIRFSPDRRARGGIAHGAAEVPFQLSGSHTGSAEVFLRLQ